MTRAIGYDRSCDPPAPVVPFGLSCPHAEARVVLPALVDTGAECTLVPAAVAIGLGLPAVDRVVVEGLGGAVRRAVVYAARVEFGGVHGLARVVGSTARRSSDAIC